MILKSLFHNVIAFHMFNIVSRNLLIKTQTLTDKCCDLETDGLLQSTACVNHLLERSIVTNFETFLVKRLKA